MIATALKRLTARSVNLERNAPLQYWLLLAITLLAAALRFYRLGEWSFWIDEVLTLKAAQNPLNLNITWPRISLMLIAATLRMLGTSEWNARLVPALIGILTIPVLYLPIKKMFGAGVSLVAGILLAVSPWHLYWSQNARFYTSLMLLYTLALLVFYFAFEGDHAWYIPVSLFLFALATVERFTALFFVPVVACYLLLLRVLPFEKPPGFRLRNLFLLVFPGVAVGFLEVYHFVISGSFNFLAGLGSFLGSPNHGPLRLLLAMTFRIGIPLACLGFFGAIHLMTHRVRAGTFVSLAALAPPFMLLLIAPFTFTVDRYVFVSLPFWAILGAIALKEMFVPAARHGKLLLLGILLLLLADPLSQDALYYSYQNGNRPDWRGAFEVVSHEMADGDLILATRPELGHYYLDDTVAWINSMDTAAIERGGNRVWFVIDEATGWVEPDLAQWIRENCELIQVLAVSMPGKSLNIRIYLYDPAT